MVDSPRTDLARPLRFVCGVLFGAIVVLSILQVFFRSVLDSPLTWSEELSRLLLVWMTFLAAAVVSYDGTHLRVDTLFLRLSHRARRGVRAFNAGVVLVFLGVVAVYSLPILRLSAFGRTGTLDVPFAYFRAPATVGAALMFAFVLVRLLHRPPAARRAEATDAAETVDTM